MNHAKKPAKQGFAAFGFTKIDAKAHHFVRGDGLSARRISPSGACGVLSGACSGLFPRAPGP